MIDIKEEATWSRVPQLDDGTALVGGLDGSANVQAKALANRTLYLKEKIKQYNENKDSGNNESKKMLEINESTRESFLVSDGAKACWEKPFLSRVWISSECQPTKESPSIVAHGLELDPETAYAEVRLKCIAADQGYSVGEFCRGWWGIRLEGHTSPIVSKSTVEFYNGNATLVGLLKKSPISVGLNLQKWRYVFRIWY